MGVLTALPLINVGNLCCCLWVIGGGLVAAYVFQQNQPGPMSPSDGALVGLLAGLVGALVQLVVSIPLDLIVGPMQRAMVQRVLDMSGNMPSNWRDILERADQGSNRATWFAVGHLV